MPDGRSHAVAASTGATVLEVARAFEIDIEGACGGAMACATCHVIVDETHFDHLDPISEEEDEMLDLAPDWAPTSRLGCQIRLRREHDGMVLTVPRSTTLWS